MKGEAKGMDDDGGRGRGRERGIGGERKEIEMKNEKGSQRGG